MAHKIEIHDEQHGIQQAWHGLTKVSPKLDANGCWLSQWDVEQRKLAMLDPDGKVMLDSEGKPIETKYRILTCSDVPSLQIGKPFDPETYSVITNKRLLEIVSKALAGTKHQIVSLGSLCNREKVFLTISLEALKDFKVGGREFEAFLNFGNGLANGTSFFCNTSNTCTVCDNTYSMNLAHKGKALDVRLKHTKNMEAEIQNLPEIIDGAVGVTMEFRETLNSLSKVPATLIQAERTFAGFMIDDGDVKKARELGSKARQSDVLSTRSLNQVTRLTELFSRGAGNKGKDFLDVFSAVTDYYTHESAGGSDKRKQFESSEIGSGLRKKNEFFELVTNDKSRDELEKRGAFALELPEVN